MNGKTIKKLEDIEKSKEDLITCGKFDQIYSNFSEIHLSPRIPKIIVDEKFAPINIDSFEQYLEYELTINKMTKGLQTKKVLKRNIINLKKQQNNNSNQKNNKIKIENIDPNFSLIQHYIKSNKEFLRKYFDNKIRKIKYPNKNINYNKLNITLNKYKKNNNKLKKSKSMSNLIKADKNNKSLQKNNNNKHKQTDKKNISKKKYDVTNPFERLYNQGFYIKNKRQLSLLNNMKQIQTNSKPNLKNKKNTKINHSKTKSKPKTKNKLEENNSFMFTFKPKIDKNSRKLSMKMGNSLDRLIKPKNILKNIENLENKKRYINKTEYQKTIDRCNQLYLSGVEKLRKINSAPKILEKEKINISKIKTKSNLYNEQIEWKKKILFENFEKKVKFELLKNQECTFNPKINKNRNYEKFKKNKNDYYLDDSDIRAKKRYIKLNFEKKNFEFTVAKKRHFIFYDKGVFGMYNNNDEDKKRKRRSIENIKRSLTQRKLYNIDNFFLT